jgi:hypothetical protein
VITRTAFAPAEIYLLFELEISDIIGSNLITSSEMGLSRPKSFLTIRIWFLRSFFEQFQLLIQPAALPVSHVTQGRGDKYNSLEKIEKRNDHFEQQSFLDSMWLLTFLNF